MIEFSEEIIFYVTIWIAVMLSVQTILLRALLPLLTKLVENSEVYKNLFAPRKKEKPLE